MRLFNDKNAEKPKRAWQRKEREALRKKLREDTFERNGALVWKSSGNVVPEHCFLAAAYLTPKNQSAERKRQEREQLAEYRERMKDYKPSAEEIYEMEAAFGPGETIVNVLTGQVIHRT